jgi:hypothetical protein
MVDARERTREGWPVGVVAAATFIGAVLLIIILSRLARDREPLIQRVAERDVPAFEAAVQEDLSPVTLRPADRLRVRATRVAWLDDRRQPWVESPQVTFSIAMAAALGGAVVLEDGVVESPRVRLVQYAPGRWNYQPALEPLLDVEPPPSPDLAREVRLRGIVVRNGRLDLMLPEASYQATEVRAVLASGELAGPRVAEPRFHLSSATANLLLPGPDDERVSRSVTLTDARLRLPDGAVGFDVARMMFGASVATGLVGVWDPALGGLGLDARGTVERLVLADIPWLRAEVPEDAVASGRVEVRPLPGDRSMVAVRDLAVRSETSAASGSLALIYGPAGQVVVDAVDLLLDPLALSLVEAFAGPLPYVGEVRGTVRGPAADIQLDLVGRLGTAPAAERFTVRLRGRAAFTDAGLELRRVAVELEDVPVAALEALAPDLPFVGVVTGAIVLDGVPARTPVTLDVRLGLAGGIVTVMGTVDLRGAVPAYDVTGRIIGVELQRLLDRPVPPAQVHASFSLAGSGVSLPDAVAAVRVDGRFTGWRAALGDTLVLDARLDRGLLTARQARAQLGPIQAAAAGDWRFAHGEGGAIRYSVLLESLEPLAPFLPAPDDRPLFARGALAADGTLAGTLDAPVLAGAVRATDFRYGDWAARALEGSYDARLGLAIPRVVARVVATDLQTPGGDFGSAQVVLELTPPTFAVALRGDRAAGLGVVVVEADGRVAEDVGLTELVLRTVELDLDRQRWRLSFPAGIERGPGDLVQVTDFRLEQVEGDGVLRVNGVLAPADLTDLEIEVVALPAGDVLGLIRPDLADIGQLWLRAMLRGPAAAPSLEAELQLVGGAVRDVPIQEVRLQVSYRDGVLVVAGNGVLDEAATFEVAGTIPAHLGLGLPPGLEIIADAPIDAQLRTRDFSLAVLDPGIPTVRELEGLLTANVSLSGTPLDPALSGSATLRDGAVTIRLLNQRYHSIEGEATLEGEVLRVDRLVARSDGTASLTGTVRFEDLANPVLELATDFVRFRPQSVGGRRDAAVSGRLAIAGTPASPLLSGRLVVADGTLDLARLQPPGRLSDDLIGITERFDPLGPAELDLLEPAETGVRVARLDLTLADDVWFQTDEFRIQLGGDLVIQKPAADVMIVGSLTGERGTFHLRVGPATRRFEIVAATLQFFGNPGPDPALDITAARIIPGPNRTDFELHIRMTGTLGAPAIAFATEDGTSIPEAEALNFLVFGRATATLADFPGAGLGTTQSLYDALAFYGAFDWVSAALAEQFGAGIDYFQILARTEAGEFGPEIAFLLGHQIIDDVFVLVTIPTAEFEARWAITAEWRIDRQWTLEAGYEPPDLVIGVPGRRLPFALEREQQLFTSIRRRWTY